MALTTIDNFINNEFVKPTEGAYFDTFNPAHGVPHAQIPDSTKSDVDLAYKAASTAFTSWSKTTKAERARILYKIADLIDERQDEFVRAESKDQGKPISLAKSVDIPRAAYNFRFFAGRILHSVEEAAELEGVGFNYSQRMPIGVAGLISPWNLYVVMHLFLLSAFFILCVLFPFPSLAVLLISYSRFCMFPPHPSCPDWIFVLTFILPVIFFPMY